MQLLPRSTRELSLDRKRKRASAHEQSAAWESDDDDLTEKDDGSDCISDGSHGKLSFATEEDSEVHLSSENNGVR